MGADHLDDEDVPALTTGQAAGCIGVRAAFLRSLDAGGMLSPHRSAGGHRRWTRRQLTLAARVRELFDEGLTLTASWKIVSLEDRLDEVARERDAVRAELDRTRRELALVRRDTAAAPPPARPERSGAPAASGRTVKAGAEHTARVPSPAPAHPGSGHRRAGGRRSAPACSSTTPATATDTPTP